MVTRLYHHRADSALSNLPTTRQYTPSATFGGQHDLLAKNRSMDKTIGTNSLGYEANISSNASTSQRHYYFSRFVSTPLNAQTINANTWTWYIGTFQSNGNANFPANAASQVNLAIVYVWRPSTQSVVGYIISGNTNATWNEYASGGYYSQIVTFSGASVVAQANDVLIQEMQLNVTQTLSNSYTITLMFDGDTVVTPAGTSAINHASYLETPQDLSFTNDILNGTSDWKDCLQASPQQLITNSI